MKGHERIIASLNDLLAEELSAINQYMVHAEMADNWGYGKLHASIEERAIVEMRHAENLIERILYLEGQPIVTNLHEIKIGQSVEQQYNFDLGAEKRAVEMYNNAIIATHEFKDSGTRQLLESILKQEEGHVDFLEAQLDAIKQMGIQNYLPSQLGEEEED